jgi:hypothetical protein
MHPSFQLAAPGKPISENINGHQFEKLQLIAVDACALAGHLEVEYFWFGGALGSCYFIHACV